MAGAIPLVGLGVQAIGGYKQYRAQRKAANAATTAANINAMQQQAEADQQEMEARAQIARMRTEGMKLIGKQKASYAAAGVVGSSGSPLDVITETAGKLALEQSDLARVAQANKERGYAAAAETRRTGKLQASGLRAQATGTALSTVAGLGKTVMNYGATGVPGFDWAAPKKLGT